jgi:PadR family transcriptional regulator PadR
VLEVLLRADDELYGFKIAQAIDRPTGSVFPILARLEQKGWAISEWEAGGPSERGARRRFYRLSPEGFDQARAVLAERRPVLIGRRSNARVRCAQIPGIIQPWAEGAQ